MKIQRQNYNLFLPLGREPKFPDWPKHIHKSSAFKLNNTELVGFDTETKGLNPFDKNVHVISAAVSDGQNTIAYVINHNGQSDEIALHDLRNLIENPDVTLVGHNIKFDLKWLLIKYNWTLRCQVFDTMMASYLIDENDEAGLDNSLKKFLNRRSHKGMVNTADLESEHVDDVLLYNAYDADSEIPLMKQQVKLLHVERMLPIMSVAAQVFPILAKMEVRGVNLDREHAKRTEAKLLADCIKLSLNMRNAGYGQFDPNSDKDLRRILYSVIGFQPTKQTKSGADSVDAEAIKDLYLDCCDNKAMGLLDNLIPYTKKMKLLSTYYQPIDRWLSYDKRVHTSYSLGKQYDGGQGGTVTGRLSSTNPNLQNIPRGKEHRGMFIPTKDYLFIDGDFSQLELRVGAFLSQEPRMIEAFLSNKDIHSAAMSDITGIPYDEIEERKDKDQEIKNQRVGYKNVNFGIFYGMTEHRLFRQLKSNGIHWDIDKCIEYIAQWKMTYASANAWIELQKKFIRSTGYAVMPLGQKRRLPDAKLERIYGDRLIGSLISRAERQGVNFIVQSTAAWICLIGMIVIDQYFKDHPELDGHLIMQVHDSVTSEVKADCNTQQVAQDIQYIMENCTVQLLNDVFGIKWNVPLSFPTKVITRWE